MSYLKSQIPQKDEQNGSSEKRVIKNNRPISARIVESHQYIPTTKFTTNQPTSYRPNTGKSVSDMNALFRNLPRSPNINRERLYEENLSLKIKANILQEENLKLKTKINQIEKNLNKREDASETILYKIASRTHLIPNLKISIKDLKDSIKAKEEEIEKLKKNIKSTKMVEIDVEIQSYIDECTRLRHHLEEVMAQKKISYSSLEFEEKLYRQNMDINLLRQENQDYSLNLEKAREEMIFVKEKISLLENPIKKHKKSSNKKSEIARLTAEINEMKEKLEKDKELFLENERKLKIEAENLISSNEKISEKIQSTEIKLQEQNIILEQLKNQMIKNEKDLKRSQTINAPSIEIHLIKKKLQNPNKLLRRIHQIICKKQMLSSVFFSLMDKDSNGFIEVDEIYRFISMNGRKIKKRDIVASLESLGILKSNIPIITMEEHYNKYDYVEKPESPSSSEEFVESPKKAQIEKLSYLPNNSLPISNDPIVPTPSIPGPRIIKEVKKVPTVKVEEIQGIIEDISMKMRRLKQPKNKVLSIVFGNDIDVEQSITTDILSTMLSASKLQLVDKEKVRQLSKFLLEPEKVTEITDTEELYLSGNIFDICKKLMKYIKDWEVYTDIEIKSAMKSAEISLAVLADKIAEKCLEVDKEHTGTIKLKDFKKVVEDLEGNLTDKIWDIWNQELYPSYILNYTKFLKKISPKTPEKSLKMLAKKISEVGASPESIFTVSNQGIINAEDFIGGVSKLGLSLTNLDLMQLLEAIRYKRENNFTLLVHITELRNLLSKHGLRSAMLSSSSSSSSMKKSREAGVKEEENSEESSESDISDY